MTLPALTRQERAALLFVGCLVTAAAAVRAWPVLLAPPPGGELAGAAEAGVPALRAEVAEEAARDARRRTPLAPGERIDLSEADAVELARLPGIGPVLADRIVAWRDARGGVAEVGDLEQVSGVGPVLLARVRDHLHASGPGPVAAPASASPDEPIDVNRADARTLQRLPGVGPVLAERIVESRTREGPFRTLDDLIRVPGIGPATVQRLAPMVVLGPS